MVLHLLKKGNKTTDHQLRMSMENVLYREIVQFLYIFCLLHSMFSVILL